MAKWDLSKLPEGRKPLPDEWFAERAQMQDRIKGLEAQIKEDALQYLSDTGQMCDRIEELEAKLAKAEVLQEAQKLFNYYAVEIVTYGATVARLQNLENAWLNLKTQAELTGGKDE